MAGRKVIRLFLVLLCGSCLLAGGASAQLLNNEGKIEGRWESAKLLGTNLDGSPLPEISFRYRLHYKLWGLMGEPVRDLEFVWSMNDTLDQLQLPEEVAGKPLKLAAGRIDVDARRQIRLFDALVQIRGHMRGSSERISVDIDADVPGVEGEPNLHVPASPSWDKLFYRGGDRFNYEEREYLSAEEAKRVMREGFIGEEAAFVRIKAYITPVVDWYERNFGADRYAALNVAADALVAETLRILDLDTEAIAERSSNRSALAVPLAYIRQRAEQKRADLTPGAFDELEQYVAKLRGGVPPEYRVPAREAAYQETLARISHQLDESLAKAGRHSQTSASAYATWKRDKERELAARKPVSRLPAGVVEVKGARYAPLDGLNPGSREAQERQRAVVEREGLPLEAALAKSGIVFRLVPAGSFDREGKPVTLTKNFYAGKFEVTQAQWQAVMGNNPSHFNGSDHPVEQVSWEDCQEFLRQLGQQEGLPEGALRLFTEAEWEYACRAGTTDNYAGNSEAMGWYKDNSSRTSHVVGQKQANAWGLHDMHGNVWEWCNGWYGSYTGGSVTDPPDAASDPRRVMRGGSWDYYVVNAYSARRDAVASGDRGRHLGFRLALVLAQ